MKITIANDLGILAAPHEEIVARHGRSHATVKIALAEDGLYRHSLNLMYSYGGFGSAVSLNGPAAQNFQAAVNAGLEGLLRRWPRPFPSEPQSVHDELNSLRQQIEARLCQPSFL